MLPINTDRIEKRIEIHAPVSRVWRALTDQVEFGKWFGVKLDQPFAAGGQSTGWLTIQGYEHYKWEAVVQKMEPEKLFSYTWHPYAMDQAVDYSKETPTLVEFHLEKTATGTLVILVETGFDRLPPHRRPDALRMNTEGWEEQLGNVKQYVIAA